MYCIAASLIVRTFGEYGDGKYIFTAPLLSLRDVPELVLPPLVLFLISVRRAFFMPAPQAVLSVVVTTSVA